MHITMLHVLLYGVKEVLFLAQVATHPNKLTNGSPAGVCFLACSSDVQFASNLDYH